MRESFVVVRGTIEFDWSQLSRRRRRAVSLPPHYSFLTSPRPGPSYLVSSPHPLLIVRGGCALEWTAKKMQQRDVCRIHGPSIAPPADVFPAVRQQHRQAHPWCVAHTKYLAWHMHAFKPRVWPCCVFGTMLCCCCFCCCSLVCGTQR